jgi:hypothetical protein
LTVMPLGEKFCEIRNFARNSSAKGPELLNVS